MYPIQTKMLTRNKFSRPGNKLKGVKGIVIHWTANEGKGANALANINFFENRKYGKTGYGSAHFFVDSKSIVQCLPENERAYHVGATSYKTSRFGSYPNDYTIGIELCVNSDGDFSVVYQQGLELAAMLVKKYKLNPATDVVRHFDITGKNCPGMFTSNHWGKTNNSYAIKYGLGNNADVAWATYKKKIAAAAKGSVPPPVNNVYPYDKNKGMGMVHVLVNNLNIRKGSSFSAPVAKTADSGAVFYCYGEENGMYSIGGGMWISAGKAYTRMELHPGYKKPESKPVAPKPSKPEITVGDVNQMFKDMTKHWAKDEVELLRKKGIIEGDLEGNFNPNQPATRAHVGAMLGRLLKYSEDNYQKKAGK